MAIAALMAGPLCETATGSAQVTSLLPSEGEAETFLPALFEEMMVVIWGHPAAAWKLVTLFDNSPRQREDSKMHEPPRCAPGRQTFGAAGHALHHLATVIKNI